MPPTPSTYRLPPARHELPLSLGLGVAFAFGLFVVMALAQMLGDVKAPEKSFEEELIAFAPPEFEEIEEEEPPPPEEEEPPPELEEEPPQLSLDQLDIALNPGTGGSLAGDFAMPTIGSTSQDLGTEDFVDFSQLDQTPRPVGGRISFPSRLKKKKVSGTIYVLIQIDEEGRVLSAELDSSDVPQFDEVVVSQVRKFRFTPPTQGGRPVRAKARLPIPIRIQ